MHPPPGVNRPSYTAIIGSVDSHTAKYVATSRAQTGKQEIVNDMQEMCMVFYCILRSLHGSHLTFFCRRYWANIRITK